MIDFVMGCAFGFTVSALVFIYVSSRKGWL